MKEQKKLTAFEHTLLRQQQAEQEELEQDLTMDRLAQHWEGISNQLEEGIEVLQPTTEKVVPVRYLWRAIAAAAGLLLLTWGYHFYALQQRPSSDIVVVKTPELPLEIKQAEEASFATLREDIQQLQKRDTAQWIAPKTLEALEELEEAYQQMKNELLEDQNGKVLINAMLENLRLRHHILEKSVLQLERIQQHSEEQLNYKEL
ncbi:MAG: hypothetical protein ACRBFS_23055 [Aureispira sp.]